MSRRDFRNIPHKRLTQITDKYAAVCYIIEGEPFQDLCRVENPDGSFNYSDKCMTQLHNFVPYSTDGEQYSSNYSAARPQISSLGPDQERGVAVYEGQSPIPPFRIFLTHYWLHLLLILLFVLLPALVIFHYIISPMLKRRSSKGRREMVQQDAEGNLSIGKIKFHPGRVLGLGSKGTCVYEGLFEESQKCAIKRIVAQTITFADREVEFLRSLQHPNLVRYLATENDPQFIYIALELAEFTLRSLVDSNKLTEIGLSKEEICKQSALGLQHLHSLDIVHRDIKPENILISFPKRPNDERNVLITDFGLSKQLTSMETVHSSSVMRYFDGTQGWMPPEIIKAKEENRNLSPSKSADIFSLGCVFHYIIFNGKHPFGSIPQEREENIKANKNELDHFCGFTTSRSQVTGGDLNDTSQQVPEELKVMGNDLVGAMINHEADLRPPIGSILKYPLFWSKKDQLQFLSEVSDRLDKDKNDTVKKIEAGRARVFGYDWKQCLSEALLTDLNNPQQKHRSYNERKMQDLLRVIRNKKNHYNDCSSELKIDLGDLPDQFFDYFGSRYPKLVVHVYKAMQELKFEPKFKDYFNQDESYVFC